MLNECILSRRFLVARKRPVVHCAYKVINLFNLAVVYFLIAHAGNRRLVARHVKRNGVHTVLFNGNVSAAVLAQHCIARSNIIAVVRALPPVVRSNTYQRNLKVSKSGQLCALRLVNALGFGRYKVNNALLSERARLIPKRVLTAYQIISVLNKHLAACVVLSANNRSGNGRRAGLQRLYVASFLVNRNNRRVIGFPHNRAAARYRSGKLVLGIAYVKRKLCFGKGHLRGCNLVLVYRINGNRGNRSAEFVICRNLHSVRCRRVPACKGLSFGRGRHRQSRKLAVNRRQSRRSVKRALSRVQRYRIFGYGRRGRPRIRAHVAGIVVTPYVRGIILRIILVAAFKVVANRNVPVSFRVVRPVLRILVAVLTARKRTAAHRQHRGGYRSYKSL